MTSKPTCFIAYPSTPTDLAEALENAIEKISTDKNSEKIGEIVGWQSISASGKPIITEVCKEIDKRDVFICDLTNINPNVLFELGYAIARNKSIWIIHNDSFPKSVEKYRKFKLINAVGYSRYINSDDVQKNFYKEKPFEKLGNIFFEDAKKSVTPNQENSTLFYVRCNWETEESLSLTKILKGLKKTSMRMDTLSNTKPKDLSWYSQEVLKSHSVIIHFVDENRGGWETHNAKCSLVSGLAHGFGKKLLMLAHSPYDSPVDYTGFLKIHTKARECVDFANEFLNSIFPPYTKPGKKVISEEPPPISSEFPPSEEVKVDPLFTEKLILIKQKKAFPGTLHVEGSERLVYQDAPVTPIIPLKVLALKNQDAKKIADMIRFEQVDDQFIVTLKLTVKGSDVGKGKIDIKSKTFSGKKGDIETLNTVPMLEIWPDFISPQWKVYYTYYSNTGYKNTFYAAAPLGSAKNRRSFPDSNGHVDREISPLDHFPEIFDILFKAALLEAYGIPGTHDFKIEMSCNPGEEVAYGLLTDGISLDFDKEKIRGDSFLAGEVFKDLNLNEFKWYVPLTVKQLKSGIRISSKPEQLEAFLNVFDQNSSSLGILPIGEHSNLLDKTWRKVNQTLLKFVDMDENKIPTEPLFIIALKELIKIKVDEWAKK